MTLDERLRAQLDEVAAFDLGWDLSIVDQRVLPSTREPSGICLRTLTRCGLSFEVLIEPRDFAAKTLAAPVHGTCAAGQPGDVKPDGC